MITVITGSPESGKIALANKMKTGKKSFNLFGLPAGFSKNAIDKFGLPGTSKLIPLGTELLVIEGVQLKDVDDLLNFISHEYIEVDTRGNDSYTIKMPDLIFTLDNWSEEYLSQLKGVANIITCSNPKSKRNAGAN